MNLELSSVLERMAATMDETDSESNATTLTNTFAYSPDSSDPRFVVRVQCSVEMILAPAEDCQCGDGCECEEEEKPAKKTGKKKK
jgi:hypothetical protein